MATDRVIIQGSGDTVVHQYAGKILIDGLKEFLKPLKDRLSRLPEPRGFAGHMMPDEVREGITLCFVLKDEETGTCFTVKEVPVQGIAIENSQFFPEF